MIDGAVTPYRNVRRKAAEKKLNNRSLCSEIQRMWYTKYVMIPVITWATGIVTEGLQKNVVAIPGEHHNT
jgi:hypothetical protein